MRIVRPIMVILIAGAAFSAQGQSAKNRVKGILALVTIGALRHLDESGIDPAQIFPCFWDSWFEQPHLTVGGSDRNFSLAGVRARDLRPVGAARMPEGFIFRWPRDVLREFERNGRLVIQSFARLRPVTQVAVIKSFLANEVGRQLLVESLPADPGPEDALFAALRTELRDSSWDPIRSDFLLRAEKVQPALAPVLAADTARAADRSPVAEADVASGVIAPVEALIPAAPVQTWLQSLTRACRSVLRAFR